MTITGKLTIYLYHHASIYPSRERNGNPNIQVKLIGIGTLSRCTHPYLASIFAAPSFPSLPPYIKGFLQVPD